MATSQTANLHPSINRTSEFSSWQLQAQLSHFSSKHVNNSTDLFRFLNVMDRRRDRLNRERRGKNWVFCSAATSPRDGSLLPPSGKKKTCPHSDFLNESMFMVRAVELLLWSIYLLNSLLWSRITLNVQQKRMYALLYRCLVKGSNIYMLYSHSIHPWMLHACCLAILLVMLLKKTPWPSSLYESYPL